MSKRLSDEQLDAIEARVNGAQPGPWVRYSPHDHASLKSSNGEMVAGTFGWEWGGIEHEADADFIAHAREDVPALLAEVRRLRAVDRNPSAAEWDGTLAAFRPGWPPTVGSTWERMFWEAGFRIALDPIGRP